MDEKDLNQVIHFLIYHKNCLDGTTSKYVFQTTYNVLETVASSPSCDTTRDIAMVMQAENQRIVFVDLFPSLDTLIALSKRGNQISVLDHHDGNKITYDTRAESIKFNARDHPNIEIVYDVTRSGCQLAWDYCNSTKTETETETKTRPWVVDYIGDRDLWVWNRMVYLKEVWEVLSGLHLLDSLIQFHQLCNMTLQHFLSEYYTIGSAMVKKKEYEIVDYANQSKLMTFSPEVSLPISTEDKKTFRILLTPVVPYLHVSDLGSFLMEGKGPLKDVKVDFVAIPSYDIGIMSWKLSLRSSNSGADVSQVARWFGGNGHRNASGLTLNGTELQKVFVPVAIE